MMVWHYAPWVRLREIAASGALRPSNSGAPLEKPLLWFSAHQKWEPTAAKLIASGAQVKQLTFAEQADVFGCVRFGLLQNDCRLMEWKEACRAAGTPREARRAMERTGRARGGNPAHWFAVLSKIPLTELAFEIWIAQAWQPSQPSLEMAAVWENYAAARV